jgi:hypothetical protein
LKVDEAGAVEAKGRDLNQEAFSMGYDVYGVVMF